MAEQTTEIATDADGFKTLPVVLTVDDVDYPVDLARIDARQVVLMRRELAVSPADMIARLDVGQAEREGERGEEGLAAGEGVHRPGQIGRAHV